MFNNWKRYLKNGFNLLFYGVGSKLNLIEQFGADALCDSIRVVINGYHKSVSSKKIIDAIMFHIESDMPYQSYSQNHMDILNQTIKINKFFTENDRRLYIIIHSLDDLARNNPNTFNLILNELCSPPAKIHVIASVNHQYSPILVKDSLNFLWIETNTFEPYIQEIQNSKIINIEKDDTEKIKNSTFSILSSLSDKFIKFFCVYIHILLRDSSSEGVKMDELFSKCRKLLITTNKHSFYEKLNLFIECGLLIKNENSNYIKTRLNDELMKEVLKKYKSSWIDIFNMSVF